MAHDETTTDSVNLSRQGTAMQRLRSSQTVIQRALIILICAALAAALGWVLFSEQGQRLV
jgi:hypothetical protein